MAIYIRATLNKYPIIPVGICVLGVIGVIYFFRTSLPHKVTDPTSAYTTDDGASYFSIEGSPISPAMSNGKPAYHVNLFKDNKGSTFVGYMDRYNDKAKALIDSTHGDFAKGGFNVFTKPEDVKAVKDGYEVKQPGEKEWKHIGSDNPSLYLYRKTIKAPSGAEAHFIAPTDQLG